MKFSIIVPTYNEEKDIRATLESLVRLDYEDREILIVDDSTDGTPAIVQTYAEQGVRLIHPGGGGRCEARNLGIQAATGEVVVILNADVLLPTDFLVRLRPHYEAGAGYVVVRSRVANRQDLFARYVECVGEFYYGDPDKVEWTEGFSCRRDAALSAGLFPVGFPVPICAGEDGFFGTNLRALGVSKVADFDLCVEHVAPASFSEYWYIRKGRGQGSAQVHRFLNGWSFPRIVIWNLLKSLRLAAYIITLLPMLAINARLLRFSNRGLKDLLPFCYAWLIEQVAFQVGDLQSALHIMRQERLRTVNNATSTTARMPE